MNEDPNHNPASGGEEPELIGIASINHWTWGSSKFDTIINFLKDGAIKFTGIFDFKGRKKRSIGLRNWRLEAHHRDRLFSAFLHPVPETEEERRRLLVEALRVATKTSHITDVVEKAGITITSHNPAAGGEEPELIASIDHWAFGRREIDSTIEFLKGGAVKFTEIDDYEGNENFGEKGSIDVSNWRLEADHRDSLFTAFLHPVPETEEERRRLLVEALKVAMKTSNITGLMEKAGITITYVPKPKKKKAKRKPAAPRGVKRKTNKLS